MTPAYAFLNDESLSINSFVFNLMKDIQGAIELYKKAVKLGDQKSQEKLDKWKH